MTTTDRIAITYDLAPAPGERADSKARDIALEQTVELPAGCYPEAIAERIVGHVESVERRASGARAEISYDPVIVAGNLLGLLNLMFGNISMKTGIRVVRLHLPEAVLVKLRGPAFGIAGVRRRCGVARRPLLCAAAKPVGLSAVALARLCGGFAEAGVDVIKDDHSLGDQETARFRERVARCSEAVAQANARTGGRACYVPNVLPGARSLEQQLAVAAAADCAGIVVSPWLVGFDTVRRLAQDGRVLVFAHPSFSGALLGERHGVAPDILYGTLCRLAGSDAVIYPNAGGRFPFSEQTCRAINDRLREPLGDLAPAFPVAGGGVDAERVPYWIEQYGADTILLIGSSFYAQSDVMAASRQVADAVRRYE